jgi:hypothetical protein
VGAPKSEFGADRDAMTVLDEIAVGQATLARRLGDRQVPVFIPPWNSFHPKHFDALSSQGFLGLSRYGHRDRPSEVQGVRQVNTHIDILQWNAHGGPRCLPIDEVLRRLAGLIQRQRLEPMDAEPIGLLTHHRAMQADAWSMLNTLFTILRSNPGVSWASPPELFAPLSTLSREGIQIGIAV